MRTMKDSGIEWIGEIPESWGFSKLKYIGTYINGYAFKPDDWGSVGKKIIRIQDLTGSNDNPNYYNGTIDSKYNVTFGDILVSWAATLDAFIWTKEDGLLNQHIFKAVPDNSIISTSFFFWLIKEAMKNMNNDNKHGIFMQHVTLDVFNNFSVPLPPMAEQEVVASFLDRQCDHIDNIIKKTKASIEEYKKLRQAVITQAVTKGVRGDRPMKDTGFNWLLQIPADWTMERGKNLFFETNNRSESGEEELLTVSQYTGITPRSQKNVNMFEAETLEGYKICEIGDIAANTMWLWAGAIGVSEYYGVISPSYNIYRQKTAAYNSKYLDYLLRIPPIVQLFASLSTGIRASRLRLYPEQFLNIYYPLPPLDEQAEIVAYLQEKIIEVDKLITKKEQFLTELESYKKSMIYEYVTGKKEVPQA